MSRDLVNAICTPLPGAKVSDPWGGEHDAWKVGGKMFACRGASQTFTAVKTDSIETAELLISLGVGERAAYFHRSWISLPDGTDEAELRHRIHASYRIIRGGLTRKVQSTLSEFLEC